MILVYLNHCTDNFHIDVGRQPRLADPAGGGHEPHQSSNLQLAADDHRLPVYLRYANGTSPPSTSYQSSTFLKMVPCRSLCSASRRSFSRFASRVASIFSLRSRDFRSVSLSGGST